MKAVARRPPRLVLVLFGLFFGGIPLVFMLPIAAAPVVTFFQSGAWESVPCVITHSAVAEQKNDTAFVAEVGYEYAFQGKTFTSQRVGIITGRTTGSHAAMKAVADRFPAGTRTSCLVNPAAPAEAMLERDFPWGAVGGCAFLLPFIGAGAGLVLWGAGAFSKKKETTPDGGVVGTNDNPFVRREPVPLARRKNAGRLIPFLFGVVFTGLGGAALFFGVQSYWKTWHSADWVETPCVIQRSEVKSRRSDDSTTYSVYVRFAYEWQGARHIGERYDFSTGSDSGSKSKYAAVKANPRGKKTVCYVNPRVPSEAVLVRSAGGLAWLPVLIGGVFSLFGVLALTLGFFAPGRKQVDPVAARTPAPLPMKTTPRRAFLFLLVFSIIWNGFVFFFLTQFLREQAVELFETVFFSVFVLVGIGVVGATLWTGLSVFGAKLAVVMRPVVYPGEAVPLTWRLEGNSGAVTALKLCLKCVEQFSVDDGKHRKSRENTLEEITLLDLRGPLTTATGELRLAVPLDVRVSSDPDEGAGLFQIEDGTVKISWHIRGEVRRKWRPKQVWQYRVILREREG